MVIITIYRGIFALEYALFKLVAITELLFSELRLFLETSLARTIIPSYIVAKVIA